MDVKPCYPLFSAELESAEALASVQEKFYSLNLADCKVMRKLLPMYLSATPTCLGSMVSNPDQTSDVICDLEFSLLATDEEIEPDNLCTMNTPKVIEEIFLRIMKQVWIWNTTGRKELMNTVIVHCLLLWVLCIEVEIHAPSVSNLEKIQITSRHSDLTYNMTKIDPKINSLCKEDTASFYHLIVDCPRLRQAMPDCELSDFDTDSWIPERLMEFARTPAMEALWPGIRQKVTWANAGIFTG